MPEQFHYMIPRASQNVMQGMKVYQSLEVETTISNKSHLYSETEKCIFPQQVLDFGHESKHGK